MLAVSTAEGNIMKSSINPSILLSLALSGVALSASSQMTPQQAVGQMTRGINLGRCLELNADETPRDIQDSYFDDIADAGFNFVRIPVQWGWHTGTSAPYTIDSAFLDEVEQAVDWALARNLIVIINTHHEDWILYNSNFTANDQARFEAIWNQVATRFQNKADNLIFEIANEPINLSISQVNQLNAAVIPIIRASNPTRIIIYSGNGYTGLSQMKSATRPNDSYVMATFHSYDPWPFAGEGSGTWGSSSDYQAVTDRFDEAAAWSAQYNIPVLFGEWGTVVENQYPTLIDTTSRQLYLAKYASEASRTGIAPCIWNDFGWFGIYYPDNPAGNRWNYAKDIIMANTSPAPVYPFRFTDIDIETNTLHLTWSSAPGGTYAVEFSFNLLAWTNLATGISSGGTNTSVSFDLASTSTGPNALLAQYQLGTVDAQIQDTENLVAAGPLTPGSGATLFDANANVSPAYASQPELQIGFSAGSPDLATAVLNQTWFTFTLSVGANVSDMDLASLTFNAARGGAAQPRGYGVYVTTPTTTNELIQGATNVQEQRPTWDPQSIDLSGVSSLQNLTNGQEVTFTIPIYAPAPGNSLEFDDITVNGKSTFGDILSQGDSPQVFFRILQ